MARNEPGFDMVMAAIHSGATIPVTEESPGFRSTRGGNTHRFFTRTYDVKAMQLMAMLTKNDEQ